MWNCFITGSQWFQSLTASRGKSHAGWGQSFKKSIMLLNIFLYLQMVNGLHLYSVQPDHSKSFRVYARSDLCCPTVIVTQSHVFECVPRTEFWCGRPNNTWIHLLQIGLGHGINCDSEQHLNFGGTLDAFLLKRNENIERILENDAKEKCTFVTCRYHCGHIWSQLAEISSWFIIPQEKKMYSRWHFVAIVSLQWCRSWKL